MSDQPIRYNSPSGDVYALLAVIEDAKMRDASFGEIWALEEQLEDKAKTLRGRILSRAFGVLSAVQS